jgi:hypothetical protein
LTASIIHHTNAPPTNGMVSDLSGFIMPPPGIPGNLTYQLEWSTDLVHWASVTNITIHSLFPVVHYLSNYVTHTMVPVSTNYYTNIWDIPYYGPHAFFRFR